MWALSPSIFSLFSEHLLLTNTSVMDCYPAAHYAIINAFYSLCSRFAVIRYCHLFLLCHYYRCCHRAFNVAWIVSFVARTTSVKCELTGSVSVIEVKGIQPSSVDALAAWMLPYFMDCLHQLVYWICNWYKEQFFVATLFLLFLLMNLQSNLLLFFSLCYVVGITILCWWAALWRRIRWSIAAWLLMSVKLMQKTWRQSLHCLQTCCSVSAHPKTLGWRRLLLYYHTEFLLWVLLFLV